MKLILLICLFLSVKFSFADEPRRRSVFNCENKKFQIRYSKGFWRVSNSRNKVLYKIEDLNYESMSLLLSNDGKSVVVIDDLSEHCNDHERIVLSFYRNGELKSKYKIRDLLKDSTMIRYSVSHCRFTLNDFGFINHDASFSIATREFTELEFDTANGKITARKRPSPYNENSLIVHGKFIVGKNFRSTMKIDSYISGAKQQNDQITFKSNYSTGEHYGTLMINENVDVTPKIFKSEIY